MGIHIPENIIEHQAVTASLQHSIDSVKQQVYDELDRLGIGDLDIIRNSQLLTLALTHTEALDNVLGNSLSVDKIRREIYANYKNDSFDLDDIESVKKYLDNHKTAGVYVGDERIYIQDIEKPQLNKIMRNIIFPKYIKEKLH